MYGSRLLILVAVWLACVDLAFGRDWAEYRSEHFTVLSDAKEGEVFRVLSNFEKFRRVVLQLLQLADEPESERLKIYIYDNSLDFNRLVGSSKTSGFFYHSIFGPRMVIGPYGSFEDMQSTLFHEYVHYLMNERASVNHPRWYQEGIATLMGFTRFEKTAIVVGGSGYKTIADVYMSSVSQMLEETGRWEHYRIAWLLVHYLLIDSYEDLTKRTQLEDYLRRYDAGESQVDAFEKSFGMSPGDMTRELSSLAQYGRLLTLRLPQFDYEGEFSKRALEPDEQLYHLIDIVVENNGYESVRRYIDDYEDLEVHSPFSDKIRSRQSIALIHEGKIEDGDALFRELIAKEPTDADIIADIAHYAYDRYYAAHRSGEAAEIYLDQAIRYGRQATEANPYDLEALYYLGLSYERRGEIQQAADTLLTFYDISPSSAALNLALARVMIKGRQIELASYLVSRMVSSTESTEARERLLELRAVIDGEDFDVSTIDDQFQRLLGIQ